MLEEIFEKALFESKQWPLSKNFCHFYLPFMVFIPSNIKGNSNNIIGVIQKMYVSTFSIHLMTSQVAYQFYKTQNISHFTDQNFE